MQETWARRATPDDAGWIVELSARVQYSLTASGSRQQIGPLPLESTKQSILAGNVYLLETTGKRLGSVLVEPLDTVHLVRWKLPNVASPPWWYLHSLMLEPEEQGKGLGLVFLAQVKHLMAPCRGTIVLDCWAGNAKLRDFYQRAEFRCHGAFPEKDYQVAVFVYSLAAATPGSDRTAFS